MLIRTIRPEDAEQLVQLKHQIDQETTFMLFEVDERKMTITEQRDAIERLLADNISMIFVAEHEEHIVGFLSATSSHLKRIRHTLYIVIGIKITQVMVSAHNYSLQWKHGHLRKTCIVWNSR